MASKVVDMVVGQCSDQPQFAHIRSSQSTIQSVVQSVASKVAMNIAKAKKDKELSAASACKTAQASMKGTMKWLPFQSTLIIQKMCDLIKTGVQTNKGFKEVHLVSVSKALSEHYGGEVTSTQVYNHLRKWRTRWIQINKLRDLSGTQWDEETCTIVLETDHYQVKVHLPSCVVLVINDNPYGLMFSLSLI
jgi:hypothetical protein